MMMFGRGLLSAALPDCYLKVCAAWEMSESNVYERVRSGMMERGLLLWMDDAYEVFW